MSETLVPSPTVASSTSDGTTPVLIVTDSALATILDARSGELDAASLSLWLEVGGTAQGKFQYEMYFQPTAEAAEGDTVVARGDLTVVIPAGSHDRIIGSTLDLATDGSGMVLSNPNEPKAPEPAPAPKLTGSLEGALAVRVMQVIDQQVNPSIASHGGFATLLSVDTDTVFITMGGGCQGCAMSKATLKQGIEVAIKQAVPEIIHVIDMTDHATGANPYYN
jgi:Fe/S biogenesis protein NfuA